MTKQKQMSFTDAVSRFRSVLIRRAKKNTTVSSVDISAVVPSVTGPRRGAAVRRAFDILVSDGVLKRTSQTVYNRATESRVAVYRVVG